MSFFNKVKAALGFSGDSEVEEELRSATPARQQTDRGSSSSPRSLTAAKHKAVAPSEANTDIPGEPASAEAEEVTAAAVPQEIFSAVVKLFNDSLPDFLKASVDPKVQKKLIYDSLGESMKEYIASLEQQARRRTDIAYRHEREKLNAEIEDVRKRAKQLETTSAEVKEQKLSADRQKRALTERVHDLEQQIAALEAEREQNDIQNKSLVNKLRVLSTQEGDLASLREDNEELRAEVNRLRAAATASNSAGSVSVGAPDTENQTAADIEAVINEAVSTATAELNSNIDRLTEQLSALETEKAEAEAAKNEAEAAKIEAEAAKAEMKNRINELESDIDTLKKRCEMADTMVSELNRKAALARQDSSNSAEQQSELQRQLDEANSELEEARSALEQFQTVLEQFEILKNNKDKEIASLKSTIQNNLLQQAESETALRDQISILEKSLEDSRLSAAYPAVVESSESYGEPTTPHSEATGSDSADSDSANFSSAKVDSADSSFPDDFDDINWLTGTPAPDPDAIARREAAEEEFGYREPKRKKIDDNPAQMSLF